MFGLSPMEMVIIGSMAVLLFGKNLPQVAKKVGKGMAEFRKGMQGIEQEVRQSTSISTSTPSRTAPSRPRFDDIDDRDEATAPKFEPPPEE